MHRPAAAAVVLLAAGCASAAARAPIDVPAGRVPTPSDDVARAVGALLGDEPAAARAAEATLLALDAAGRDALARHAAAVPTERDPRFLHVLDAHGLLPPLRPDDAVAFRLWQASRDDPGAQARARAALVAQARRDPAPLVTGLRAGQGGAAMLALALGEADASAAGPALLALYREATSPAERRAAAVALRTLVAPTPGPDPDAAGAEVAVEVARIAPRVEARAKEGSRGMP